MRKEHCPLKIILPNAIREVKCMYGQSLRNCPEDHTQCFAYSIHKRNTIDIGKLVAAARITLGSPEIKQQQETKPYEEPAKITPAYKTEEQKALETRALESGLSVEDLLRSEQDIILPPPKPIEGDTEEKRYSL